jgi:hypothetical protein
MRQLLLFWISTSLLCAACFRTRPVEPPDNTLSNWVSPTDYTTLLRNFQNAIANRNTQNYLRCFHPDSMRFVPAASKSNQSLWTTWSLRDEQTYFENMQQNLASLSGNSLTLKQLELRDITATSLRYIGTYRLQINHKDTAVPRVCTGQIQLLMRLEAATSEWTIREWDDIETVADSSWSELKVRYIQ